MMMVVVVTMALICIIRSKIKEQTWQYSQKNSSGDADDGAHPSVVIPISIHGTVHKTLVSMVSLMLAMRKIEVLCCCCC